MAPSDSESPGDPRPPDDPAGSDPGGGEPARGDPAEVWERDVRPALKPLVRAIYSGGSFTGHDGERWFFAVPNQTHADKCELHRSQVEQALTAAVGAPVRIVIEVGSGAAAGGSSSAAASGDDRPGDDHSPATAGNDATGTSPDGSSTPSSTRHDDNDDDIDLDDLTDAPPEATLSPIDRLAQAFPGAELVDDD